MSEEDNGAARVDVPGRKKRKIFKVEGAILHLQGDRRVDFLVIETLSMVIHFNPTHMSRLLQFLMPLKKSYQPP